MPLKSLTPRGQRGMALILAVVITGICVVIAAGLMRYMLSEYQAAHLDWRQVQALYCAEAGVEYAMDALINGDAVADTEVTLVALGLEDAEGSFRVSTEEVTSAGLLIGGRCAHPGYRVFPSRSSLLAEASAGAWSPWWGPASGTAATPCAPEW